MTLPDLKQLEAIVKPAAHDILVPGFGKLEYTHKSDGSIITAADKAMQSHLVTELQKAWPDYAILGEEMTEDEQRAAMTSSAGYWCIDPLDGTSNFATGMPFFAVSIALIVDNRQVLGFIYDPLREEVFTAIKGEGAALNGNLLKCTPNKTEVDSRYNVYLHGGQKPWDYAAGNLILHEAGGFSVSLDGDAVFTGEFEDRSVLASQDVALFDYWKQWLGLTIV